MDTLQAVGFVTKTRPVQAYKNAVMDSRCERAKLSKRESKPIPHRARGSHKYRQ
ncbi:uncharacterized protein PpBr36_06772 [Pyricularia pennisetigena]|uniref:uncharacterized protein n=1 Tax=Pyricularia pennisetigena TaxID=1578925 RepID=UPI00114ED36D|nr:uncharacterized protein PpBr36_06772 [Pyricularia pennisetigena]TLS23233.1 hypothetical protein PpBr36_06772 [Pyricularia pennisetigena]